MRVCFGGSAGERARSGKAHPGGECARNWRFGRARKRKPRSAPKRSSLLTPGAEPRAPWRRKFPDRPLPLAGFPDTAPCPRCPARAPPTPAAPGPGIRQRGRGAKGHPPKSRAFAPAGFEKDLPQAGRSRTEIGEAVPAPRRNAQGRTRQPVTRRSPLSPFPALS